MAGTSNLSHQQHVRAEVILYSRMGCKAYMRMLEVIDLIRKAERLDAKLSAEDTNRHLRKMSPKRLNALEKTLIRSSLSKQIALVKKIDGLTDEAWDQIHIFLDAAAMVSKYLWGENKTQANNRAAIRKSLQVGEDSSLADRLLRNHFQHFDERLEQWETGRSEPGIFIDRWIHFAVDGSIVHNTTNSFTGKTRLIDLTKDSFRFLNAETLNLHYRGESYDLKQIFEELKAIVNVKRREPEVGSLKPKSSAELAEFLKQVEVTYRKRPTADDLRAYMKQFE
jgi:hypothetical protein